MHDFGKLIYLDLHKTGSSFVSEFLRHSVILPEVAERKHAFLRGPARPDAFCFISVRHPLGLYSSLYRYGLDEQGEVFLRLKRADHLAAYDSFDSFCDFLLDPAHAHLLDKGFTARAAEQMGLMSFRYLKLSLRNPLGLLSRQLAAQKPLTQLQEQCITDHVIKTETLRDDLRALCSDVVPDYFDQSRALAFLDSADNVNQSRTEAEHVTLTSDIVKSAIRDKEQMLLAHY